MILSPHKKTTLQIHRWGGVRSVDKKDKIIRQAVKSHTMGKVFPICKIFVFFVSGYHGEGTYVKNAFSVSTLNHPLWIFMWTFFTLVPSIDKKDRKDKNSILQAKTGWSAFRRLNCPTRFCLPCPVVAFARPVCVYLRKFLQAGYGDLLAFRV